MGLVCTIPAAAYFPADEWTAVDWAFKSLFCSVLYGGYFTNASPTY